MRHRSLSTRRLFSVTRSTTRTVLVAVAIFLATAAVLPGQAERRDDAGRPKPFRDDGTLAPEWTKPLAWRPIGPGNMGGRITSLAVSRQDSSRWWASTASGGLLRTTNNGVTFEHQFDREKVVSIGDVAVAPSNHDIVWVGTGECNPRNSVSWGHGVYKSVDGGKTWQHMGLEKTYQVGAVRIHPTDPNVVWVGALGRLWGANEERGLYKTTDGGATWEKALHVDEDTGVIDIQIHPTDPNTFLVATYQRRRDGFDTNDPAVKFGDGSGLYKTTDGGVTFRRVTEGLPTCKLGRIGLDYYAKDPNVVFMVLESEKIAKEPSDAPYMGLNAEDAEVGARITAVTDDLPASKSGLKKDDIVLKVGDTTVHSYTDFIRAVRQHVAGDTVKLEVSRDRKSEVIEITFAQRPENAASDGPAARRRRRGNRRSMFTGVLGGQRENLQDQQGKDGHEHGGIYKSTDGGDSWTRINSLNPRPMYFSEIRVDPNDDQRLWVLGVSLYWSKDGGKTFTGDAAGRGVHVDHHALWIDPADSRHLILGNDGGVYVTWDRCKTWDHLNHVAIGQFYHVGVDSRRNYKVYGGLQDNGSWGGPSRTRTGAGPGNTDWIRVGGGDGFRCLVDPDDPNLVYYESQNGATSRRHFVTGERGSTRPRAPRGQARGQRGGGGRRRAANSGERPRRSSYRFNWQTPFILSHHNPKIYYSAGNYVFRSWSKGDGSKAISPDITASERGSATALSESPRDAAVLYVGTDDGALWMTKDGGNNWSDLWSVAEPVADADANAESAGDVAEESDEEAKAVAKSEGEDGTATASASSNTESSERSNDGESLPKTDASIGERRDENRRRDGARRGRRGGRRRLMDRDADGDGKLQKSEMPERFAGLFDRFDTDSDGALDEKEVAAIMRGRRSGGRDGERRSEDPERRRRRPSNDAPQLNTEPLPDVDSSVATLAVKTSDSNKKFARSATEPSKKSLAALMPGRRWVSSIVASRFERDRVYVSFDGHRSDDDAPHVFCSEDLGASWRSIRGNLPDHAGSVHELVEDTKNRDILYVGTEFGAWVTLDRGRHWSPLGSELPTVAVHGFAISDAAGEIVAATHGRSLWVMDIHTLRQFSEETLTADAHLFRPKSAVVWRTEPGRGAAGGFVGRNPYAGAEIYYSLAKPASAPTLKIVGADGKDVRTLEAKGEIGLHRVTWNLRRGVTGGDARTRRFRRGSARDSGALLRRASGR